MFGGTFDPVHNGHVAMLACAVDALQPTAVSVIPVGNPWQKGRLPVAAATHRVAMLTLACSALPRVIVDERELRRKGPTYTVDTLTEMVTEYPDATFTWLIGSDAFAKLDSWHRADTLVQMTHFAVVCRARETITPPRLACHVTRIDCTPPAVSSTDIRARCAAGQTIRGLVPDPVCDYIEQHHLYR